MIILIHEILNQFKNFIEYDFIVLYFFFVISDRYPYIYVHVCVNELRNIYILYIYESCILNDDASIICISYTYI